MRFFSRNSRYPTNPVLILLSVLLPLGVLSCSRSTASRYTVMKGHFIQSVTETGELQSVHASFLSMPRINYIYGYRFKIIRLAEHGSTVHRGDTVFMVDPSSVQKFIIEKTESLENEIASYNKLKAQINNNIQDLRSQLRNEQASYEIKKLAMEKSGFEAASIKRVAELEYRQAEIKLNKIRRNLASKPKADSIDLMIQKIRITQRENDLRAAQETLDRLVVTSPLDGIIVIGENWNTGQMIRVGEDVYLGNPVAHIPDIRTMKVKGFIQENDISSIRQGMDVVVRLDALPSVPFRGKLDKIAKVCIEKDKKRIFLTEVLVKGTDLRLKPGMTVSCEYITHEADDELYVPGNCILDEKGRYYVFVLRRGKARKTEVNPGPSNNLFTVVSGNIKAGQPLCLPADIGQR